MKEQIDFSRRLIKGKIAETIFERMFLESGRFTTLRAGYEYNFPELTQYRQLPKVKLYLKKLRYSVDFILISTDKKEVYLIEVKYRTKLNNEEIKEMALRIKEVQDPSWLFIASPNGFFFEPCNTVLKNDGKIGELQEKWINKPTQEKYLKLMNEFKFKK